MRFVPGDYACFTEGSDQRAVLMREQSKREANFTFFIFILLLLIGRTGLPRSRAWYWRCFASQSHRPDYRQIPRLRGASLRRQRRPWLRGTELQVFTATIVFRSKAQSTHLEPRIDRIP